MPGIVVEHDSNTEVGEPDLFANDYSSTNEAARIEAEKERKRKALETEAGRKKAAEEAAAKLNKDYEDVVRERNDLRRDRDDLSGRVTDLNKQVSALTASAKKVSKNNLTSMWSGRTVSVVNMFNGTVAWDIGAADNANNHIMHWTYGSHYTNQHFRLERKPNGNWAMKSVSMDKYLEVFSGDNNAKIYACEPNFRDRPTQEWWITFTGAGLIFENACYPGTIVDVGSLTQAPGGKIEMQSIPGSVEEFSSGCKQWCFLVV